MSNADQMLERVQGRAGELAVPGLSPRPRRKVAVLTCMDARLDLARILGIEQGDAHVIRNAGGLVTEDAIRSLSISQRLLGTEEVVVVMHEGCGMQGKSEEEMAEALASAGQVPPWPTGAFEDLEKALGDGLALLRSSEYLPFCDAIRGLIFDPANGTLREPGASDRTVAAGP